MLLRKNLSLTDVDLKFQDDTGTFSGYASVYGGVDSYGDTIAKGAFAETLARDGLPKMFFNHEWTMPVGKWTSATEDDVGLRVTGELTPGLSLSSDVRAAMLHGTLDGLSIGGFLRKGDYEATDSGRVIHKWSKLMEISPVAFPADSSARVDSVKNSDLLEAITEIESTREIERFLRDAGSFSKGAAIALVARARVIFGVEGEPSEQSTEAKALAAIADRLKRLERIK